MRATTIVTAALAGVVLTCSVRLATSQLLAIDPGTRPDVSPESSPLQVVNPVAKDNHRGLALLRRPPGNGPFPAVVIVHPGMTTFSQTALTEYMLRAAPPSRFLAAGYVVALTTYRSREVDPQSSVSANDVAATVDYVRKLDFVDAKSIGLIGCSGGGDLALEIATTTDVAAIVAEEPASMMFTGVFNQDVPKAGERFTPQDSMPIVADPARHFSEKYQRFTRGKIATIRSPILIVQGDEQSPLNRWNAEVLVPELRRAEKRVAVNSHAGERHCFAWDGRTPDGTWRHAPAAAKAHGEADEFFRRHLSTQPKPVSASLVKHVPLESR
ncbi:MAG TPA: prolyl oligopeptidase family serine peptidase [Vicinamibacterales bacterium]|nr:prolyl oligopeptidase family serine peptidase [Vicinamibacterales bacterium]